MKKQTLTAASHRQKQVETAYYEDALLNMVLSAQLMCLIKALGHSKEEIEAAVAQVGSEEIINVLTDPLEEKDKASMRRLLEQYFQLTKVGFSDGVLDFLCGEATEKSKEQAEEEPLQDF